MTEPPDDDKPIDSSDPLTEHYLKRELYDAFANSPELFDFLQGGSLDGIWYWDLERPEHEWLSPRFWTLLGYDPAEKKHLASEWQDLIHPIWKLLCGTSVSIVGIPAIPTTKLFDTRTKTARRFGSAAGGWLFGTRTASQFGCSERTPMRHHSCGPSSS